MRGTQVPIAGISVAIRVYRPLCLSEGSANVLQRRRSRSEIALNLQQNQKFLMNGFCQALQGDHFGFQNRQLRGLLGGRG